MTNGDRIRRMTDEELAETVELIDCKTDKVECPLYNYNVAGCSRLCKSSFLQWLKQEVDHESKAKFDAQPTVDARPTEHGEWLSYTSAYWTKKYDADGEPEYKEYIFYVCKKCRRKTVIKENFCPKCGLDMRVSENKQN